MLCNSCYPTYIHVHAGRLDRKIEFPLPTEEARAHILRIHSRKMNVNPETNYDELARCTDDFNGAQLKAVCVEAGMIALRRGATELGHEDYMDGRLKCPLFSPIFETSIVSAGVYSILSCCHDILSRDWTNLFLLLFRKCSKYKA